MVCRGLTTVITCSSLFQLLLQASRIFVAYWTEKAAGNNEKKPACLSSYQLLNSRGNWSHPQIPQPPLVLKMTTGKRKERHAKRRKRKNDQSRTACPAKWGRREPATGKLVWEERKTSRPGSREAYAGMEGKR